MSRYGEYGMYTDNDGQTWRGFFSHHPSGEVYILEQDNAPGYSANYTAILGPLPRSEVTRETLENAVMSSGDPDDCAWAYEQD